MSGLEDKKTKILLDKKTVRTKAVFWQILHDSGDIDVKLKLGRYVTKNGYELEKVAPKSELTLEDDELQALISFLRDNYKQFKSGTKAYLPLTEPFDRESAEQIRKLFSLPERREVVSFVLDNNIIPDDLELLLENAKRKRAIEEFEEKLTLNATEHDWQKWFNANSWVLGSEFVRILDDRRIDASNVADFLMEAYDGFLDIIEIKRPEASANFWDRSLDHGNYVPSRGLVKSIIQATNYIFEVEREANSLKFLESVGGTIIVKPRSVLVYGRSIDWNDEQRKAHRLLNCSFHDITVMTYDHVLDRARRIVNGQRIG